MSTSPQVAAKLILFTSHTMDTLPIFEVKWAGEGAEQMLKSLLKRFDSVGKGRQDQHQERAVMSCG